MADELDQISLWDDDEAATEAPAEPPPAPPVVRKSLDAAGPVANAFSALCKSVGAELAPVHAPEPQRLTPEQGRELLKSMTEAPAPPPAPEPVSEAPGAPAFEGIAYPTGAGHAIIDTGFDKRVAAELRKGEMPSNHKPLPALTPFRWPEKLGY